MSDTDLAQTLKVIGMLSTGTLTTQLLKRGLPSTFIAGVHPLNPAAPRFVGLAYTLRLIPKREDKLSLDTVTSPHYPQRRAVEDCPPGHVLVIDARGVTETGTLGDILVTRLWVRGVAAVVTDGAMRDTKAMLGLDFPFLPRHGSLTALLTLGIPAVFISISIPPPGAGRDFMRNVLQFLLSNLILMVV